MLVQRPLPESISRRLDGLFFRIVRGWRPDCIANLAILRESMVDVHPIQRYVHTGRKFEVIALLVAGVTEVIVQRADLLVNRQRFDKGTGEQF